MVQKKNIQEIVIPVDTHDTDSCKIFFFLKTSNTISSYVLKRASIIRDIIDLDDMKVVGIPKARK